MGSRSSTVSTRSKSITSGHGHSLVPEVLPSIWWWLTLGAIAALMIWGWVEIWLGSLVTPVMQLLLLGVTGLPLMMSRSWWWHPLRKGVQVRAIYVLLLTGLLFAVLGSLLEAALAAQLPRLFLYPCLLAAAGLALLWYRDPHR